MTEPIFTQLDAVKTEDLIRILLSRYDNAVFSYYTDTKDGKIYDTEYTGDAVICKGLCMDIIESINIEAYNEIEEED